ncbi:FHA domain-containing protein [Roseimaritima sediminicola]|uniref:FHA domain-containing protein n=1 Tax=Roseimaritima sediminicola TaxID=2662066 RepID=UPI0013868D2A|nr:FHA domain-containing protein [Roseimaritima sediminicola]
MIDQQWLIGSAEDCDLLIDAPKVSAHHCRIDRVADRYYLEDCGSTNGTFLDGQRITERTELGADAKITLGRSLRLVWPDSKAAEKILFIGRAAENDVCLKHASVSALHARFLVGPEATWIVEDLDSTNGVSIDLRGVRHRIRRAVAVQPEQSVYFGSAKVPVSDLLAAAGVELPPERDDGGAGPGERFVAEEEARAEVQASSDAAATPESADAQRLREAKAMAALRQYENAAFSQTSSGGYQVDSLRWGLWFGIGAVLAVILVVAISLLGDSAPARPAPSPLERSQPAR